jgi:hypothetical protein
MTGLTATPATRTILALAEEAGLAPHLDEDGPTGVDGVARVLVNGPRRSSLFGAIYISTRTGKVLRANLTHGNHGIERRYTGAAEVRAVLASWLTVSA